MAMLRRAELVPSYCLVGVSSDRAIFLCASDADCFSETDEATLKMFSIYCSLALSFGMLHERCQKKVRMYLQGRVC